MDASELYGHVCLAGLEDRAQAIIGVARSALQVRSVAMPDWEIPVGGSKIGGLPDVSDGFAWPTWRGTRLTFVCQINVADVVRFERYRDWPSAGTLAFFVDTTRTRSRDTLPDAGSWRIVFTAGQVALHRYVVAPHIPMRSVFASCRWSFWETLTLPAAIDSLGFDALERDRYAALLDALETTRMIEGRHQLFGYPTSLLGEMELACQHDREHDQEHAREHAREHTQAQSSGDVSSSPRLDWELLLQLDTDEEARIARGELGILYFWIRRQDRLRLHFDSTRLIVEGG